MRVLHVTSEVAPYSKTGGLGDVLADLPIAQRRRGHTVTVLSPLYGSVPRAGLVRQPDAVAVELAGRRFEGHLWAGDGLLFFQAPDLFDRAGEYGHDDDPLRFAALCKLAADLGLAYDVVHLHDWQAALTALYLGGRRPVVQTIHNLAYQGICHPGWADALEIPHELRRFTGLEFHGNLSLFKAGLVLADRVTTVSPTYAREIQEEPGGQGLAGVLNHRPDGVAGLLNGIDPDRFNPATDPALAAPFSAQDVGGRAACRAALQAELGLEDGPVFALVSRAVHQKGLDLVAEAAADIVAAGGRLALLAGGDPAIVHALRATVQPGRVALVSHFDEALSRRFYGGSDFFLMPSRFEPCGLSQLIAMRYGSVPIVRRTGGLADTVVEGETGLTFFDPTPAALLDAVHRALALDAPARARVQAAGLAADWSWDRSAEAYDRLYHDLLPGETAR